MSSHMRSVDPEVEAALARISRGTGSMPLLARGCAIAAMAIGVVVLTGWATDTGALRTFLPGVDTAMKVNTAIALVTGGLAWLLRGRLGMAVAGVMALLALLILVEIAVDADLGIDQLFYSDPDTTTVPGRPSLMTAVVLLLVAASRIFAAMDLDRYAQICAIVVLPVCALTTLGYAYDVRPAESYRPLTTLALPTAIAVALVAFAALASIDGGVLTWVVRGNDAAAALLRRLVPLALVGLPVIGFGCLYAQRHGWVDDRGTATALFVVLCSLALVVLGWAVVRHISRVDRRRAQALDELMALKDDLEQKVDERAAQIERHGGQIAVLEDRQRIAADLHDVVIQRLFAAGMYLQGANAIPGDPAVAERIGTAVEAMDGAIRDLRHAIFELGGHGTARIDLTSAVDGVCHEAARVLGFEPDVVVDDPDEQADALREDLLAVLREALANVARHAGASSARVELRVRDGEIALTVTDDGRGMTELPHRSGTRNMRDRATQHGGDCTWTGVTPHGTRLRWHVPVAGLAMSQA